MVFSVFTRHSTDCKFKRDRLCRRCSCPKWIGGQVDREYFRTSARTRLWEEAERFRESLENALEKGLPPFGPEQNSDTGVVPEERMAATELPSPPVIAVHPPDPPTAEPAATPSPVASTPPETGQLPAPVNRSARITVEKAVDAYITDASSRGLKPDTMNKLENIFRKQLLPWSKAEGLEFLDDFDLDALLSFRSTWKEGALVRSKKQERLIGFFWVCFRRNYINRNPALGMSKIRTAQVPTDYFPRDEFDRIIAATHRYGDPRGGFIDIEDTRTRLRTLTLLMRWSGLRIRDAITLERNRLHGDSLLLYQAKTGQPVYVPLPASLIQDLLSIPAGPRPNRRYFFWSGNGLAKSAVADWQRSYRRLFQIADIRGLDGARKRCHPHMFRDTFAVEMLLAGVPLDQVSTLLGHSSVKITEKHYAPFVKARQLQLQASVRAAWSIDDSTDKGPDNVPPVGASRFGQTGWQLIVNNKQKMRRT